LTLATGKCPKCEKTVLEMKFSNLKLTTGAGFGGAYPAMTFECPHCHTILGAQMDLDYVIAGFMKALGRK
jgi:hypothetical protein